MIKREVEKTIQDTNTFIKLMQADDEPDSDKELMDIGELKANT